MKPHSFKSWLDTERVIKTLTVDAACYVCLIKD